MSNYILMVDSEEESLAHGKFIAKVKGLGGKVRYFYNTNEYMAFLKGGKKSYNSQKTTNQMNAAMNARGRVTGEGAANKKIDTYGGRSIKERRTQEAIYGQQKIANGKYITQPNPYGHKGPTSGDMGKMRDAIDKTSNGSYSAKSKAEKFHSQYVTNRMNTNQNASASGKAADEKAKQEAARQKSVTNRMNSAADKRASGPAADAAAKTRAYEQKVNEALAPARAAKKNAQMNAGINQQGRDKEGEIRRKEYDERVGGKVVGIPKYTETQKEYEDRQYGVSNVNKIKQEQAEKNRDKRAGNGVLEGSWEAVKGRGVAADEADKTWRNREAQRQKEKEYKKKNRYVK